MDTCLHHLLTNALAATALALLAVVVGRACRRPDLTHALWVLVLLRLLTPAAVLPVPIPWPAQEEVEPRVLLNLVQHPPEVLDADGLGFGGPFDLLPLPSGNPSPPLPTGTLPPTPDTPAETDLPESDLPVTELPGPAPAPAPALPWRPWVVGLWLAGSATWFALAASRLYRFHRLLRFVQVAPAALQDRARRLAGRLGLGRCPDIGLLPGPVSPMLWALAGRPWLLLPAALWERLPEEQQDALLAHELAHCRRGDHWVRRLELVATALYWWHPLLWWARRQLREAEEQCCDAWVVWALPGSARAYAAALVEVVLFLAQARRALPVGASGVGRVDRLKRRLTMIVQETTPRALPRAAFLAVLGLGALTLILAPTWAQAPPAGSSFQPPGSDTPPATPTRAAPPRQQPPDTDVEPGPVKSRFGDRFEGRSKAIQDAEDEAALVRVQLEVKLAEVQEARALLKKAQSQLGRMEKLRRSGVAEEGAAEQARSEVEVQQARLMGKEAHLKEAQLRVQQADRRLTAVRNRPTFFFPQGATPAPPSDTIPPASDPSAPGPRGPVARPPATGTAPSSAQPKPLQPQPGYGPAAANQPPGKGVPMTGGQPAAAGDQERRIRGLEQAVERLTQELRELRRQLERPRESPRPMGRPPSDLLSQPPATDPTTPLPKGRPSTPAPGTPLGLPPARDLAK